MSDESTVTEQFMDQRFIGMLIIMVATIVGLMTGKVSESVFQYTMLLSFLIFAGSESVDYTSFLMNNKPK